MDFTKNKTKEQLLEEIRGGSEPGSKAFEQIREAIKVQCASDIEGAFSKLTLSIERSSAASESLTSKVLWLDILLTIATVAMAITAVLTFFQNGHIK